MINFDKAVKVFKANRELNKKSIKASKSLTGAVISKQLKKMFDPYTSNVYDEVMDEKISEAVCDMVAVGLAQQEIYERIFNG